MAGGAFTSVSPSTVESPAVAGDSLVNTPLTSYTHYQLGMNVRTIS